MTEPVYTMEEIEFATCAVRTLWIMLVVTLVSFAEQDRVMLLAGLFGSLLGWIIPMRDWYETRTVNGTAEGIIMYSLHWRVDHVFMWGVLGAFLGVFFGVWRAHRIAKCEQQEKEVEEAGNRVAELEAEIKQLQG